MKDSVRHLNIIDELTGISTHVEEALLDVTAREILDAIAERINFPLGTRGVLIRKSTRKQILPNQTLRDAGIKDGESLIADFERTAGCFLGNTAILLANGNTIPIENIQVGDLVISCKPGSTQTTSGRVSQVIKGYSDKFIAINHVLKVTESHPIWSSEKWQSAGQLRVGDFMQDHFGAKVKVFSIEIYHKQVEVFNLQVESSENTFFAEGVLVHNKTVQQDTDTWGQAFDNQATTRAILEMESLGIELLSPEILRVYIFLPSLIKVESFINSVYSVLGPIDFFYSFYTILLLSKPQSISEFLGYLRQVSNLELLTSSQLRQSLDILETESLKLLSSRYGSPASFDLLGIAGVLEFLRDTMKDLLWRGKHEKSMAELEREGKQLENEKLALNIIEQQLRLMGKTNELKLSDDDRKLIVSTLLPKALAISNLPSILLLDDGQAAPSSKSS